MNNTLCVTLFFNFFHKFLNKMDGQTLYAGTHGYTYFWTKILY